MDLLTSQGRNVKLTIEQALSIYATWKREHAEGSVTSHLENGGFILAEDGRKGKLRKEADQQLSGNKISQADMDAIAKWLTREQKQYADALVHYMSSDMAELGNKASMAMFGIKKYTENNYFPMQTSKETMYQRSDAGATSVSNDNRLKHKSFTKRITNQARNALLISDFSEVCAGHIQQMITYSSFAVPVESLNRVLNYKYSTDDGSDMTVRALIKQTFGQNASDYLSQYLADLNGGAVLDKRGTEIKNVLLSTFKKSAVAGSLSVAFQQPLSYLRAAYCIDPKYLAGALARSKKGSYDEMMHYSGVAVIKGMGRFDTSMGASAVEYLQEKDWGKLTDIRGNAEKYGGTETARHMLDQIMTGLPEKMDTITWVAMWEAVKAEQHDAHRDMDTGSKEFLQLAGKRFNEVMRLTQVYDSTLSKSQTMRSKNYVAKALTSFMAEPTLTLNLLYDAAANHSGKARAKAMAMAGATYALSAILQAVVKGFFSTGRNDDDKLTRAEQFMQKFMTQLTGEMNPLNLIPGYGDLVKLLSGGDVTDNAYSAITTLIKSGGTIADVLTGDYNKGAYRAVEETAGQITQIFTNLPMRNVMRDMRAMYNFATGAGNADRGTEGIVIADQIQRGMVSEDTASLVNSLLQMMGAGYDTRNAAYYDRAVAALNRGDTKAAEGQLRLQSLYGKNEKQIQSGVNAAVKRSIEAGRMKEQQALKAMVTYGGKKDETDAWKTYQGYIDKDWEQYGAMDEAISSGDTAAMKTAWSTLRDKAGVKSTSLSSHITNTFKQQYLELKKSNPTEARKLRTSIINALMACGYSSTNAAKHVDGWKE
ncbi:MAG: hypothetical protein MJZ81_07945 [Bacteroidales bacterium]|nr:hypothetical protein [Bacteroidales bacterium]